LVLAAKKVKQTDGEKCEEKAGVGRA